MASRREDITYGTQSEEVVLSKLNSFFKKDLQLQGGFSVMDYCDKAKTTYFELKTRRLMRNQYPTTIIGANKIEFCKNENTDYYFVFSFLDGIYYIKYNKELFDTFERDDNYYRGRRTDCANVRQHIVHIPVSRLTKLETSEATV